MSDKLPSTNEALTEAVRLIDFFVECAKTNEVPVVSIGTFKTINTIKKVAERGSAGQ